ncbi:MAG: hypothetical protein A3J38_01010 [Gammaproteobacteria bacterium RIFCSPHIGHO2_12_FULL_45_9]|nr:MAG: hypothetical protein A3J38_01010 [Gammaproteobacteria bacterium RIFCSPHIGHO2_12_FULL_45_9]
MNLRLSPIKRHLKLNFYDAQAIILFGPRKVGKTTLLHAQYPEAQYFDLLASDIRNALTVRPQDLRERVQANPQSVVIIDEIQKVPALLDEIHWLLENTPYQFILCGSSARKLRYGSSNLLGGRALRYNLFPLVYSELPDLMLPTALERGLIPQHYHSQHYKKYLKSYIETYLAEEIIAEALVRKIPTFINFLEVAGSLNGELLNYANLGRECGVSAKSAKEYFQILEDTLIGFTLPPWTRSTKRRMIETARFYFFDNGIVNQLTRFGKNSRFLDPQGRAFETFLLNEIRAYLDYYEKDERLTYWRTHTGLEVDLIVGNMEVAIEFKYRENVRLKELTGLSALLEEHHPRHVLAVTLDTVPRKLEGNILVLPWQAFLKQLWSGNIIP